MLDKIHIERLSLFLLLLWLLGCGGGPHASNPTLVEADGKPFISMKEFLQAFNEQYNQRASSGENASVDLGKILELKKAFLDRFIEEGLILKKAKQLGIEVTQEEIEVRLNSLRRDYPSSQMDEMLNNGSIDMDHLKEGIRKDLIMKKVVDRFLAKKVEVTQKDARAYFEARRELFYLPKQVRASQIVVATDMKARKILGQLRDGGDFAQLAKRYSLSPDGQNGGDLGFFSPGQMPKVFDEVVFSLPVGQWSHVTRSPYGYHIFVVHKKKEARRLTFPEVKERIITEIRQKKEAKLYHEWISGMKKEAKIKVKTELLLTRPKKRS